MEVARQNKEAIAAAMTLQTTGSSPPVPALASKKGKAASVISTPSMPTLVNDARDEVVGVIAEVLSKYVARRHG